MPPEYGNYLRFDTIFNVADKNINASLEKLIFDIDRAITTDDVLVALDDYCAFAGKHPVPMPVYKTIQSIFVAAFALPVPLFDFITRGQPSFGELTGEMVSLIMLAGFGHMIFTKIVGPKINPMVENNKKLQSAIAVKLSLLKYNIRAPKSNLMSKRELMRNPWCRYQIERLKNRLSPPAIIDPAKIGVIDIGGMEGSLFFFGFSELHQRQTTTWQVIRFSLDHALDISFHTLSDRHVDYFSRVHDSDSYLSRIHYAASDSLNTNYKINLRDKSVMTKRLLVILDEIYQYLPELEIDYDKGELLLIFSEISPLINKVYLSGDIRFTARELINNHQQESELQLNISALLLYLKTTDVV